MLPIKNFPPFQGCFYGLSQDSAHRQVLLAGTCIDWQMILSYILSVLVAAYCLAAQEGAGAP